MIVPSFKYHRALIFILLAALMVSLYLLTYRAVIQTGDTLRAMDAVTSLSRHGDWLMDESNWFKTALKIRERSPLPLNEYDVEERLNILLALPLLRIAETLPSLGNIHTLWLFNIFVTALNVGLIYLLLRALNFGDDVAVIVSISAGLATNLWAYSQAFFREPLAAFFILLALLLLQIGVRKRPGWRLLSVMLATVALMLAAATKLSAALAIPAAVLFALPELGLSRKPLLRRLHGGLVLLPLLVLGFFMVVDPLPVAVVDFLAGFNISSEYIADALRTYMLSPGASIWGTSPLLLLAIGGCIMLWRLGERQLVMTICLLLVSYALGHAVGAGPHWFGGLSWPPRFLLPIVPVLMLATAPVAQALLRRRRKLFWLIWMIPLLYGIWIQFTSVSLSWTHYSDSLPIESGGLAEWEPSLTQPQYFRWVLLPGRWADLGLDFIWSRAQLPIWLISFALYAVLISALLLYVLRNSRRRWRYAVLPAGFFLLPLILLNLTAAYGRDTRTQSGQLALHEVLKVLEAEAQEDDVLLLPGDDYSAFILNHLDRAAPRPVILAQPLAQAASPKQPAQVVSRNPNDWFDLQSYRIVQHLAAGRDRLWLLADTSQFMSWSFRPLERYLALYYYPMREVQLVNSDDTVRLLEYSTRQPAPNPMLPYSGDISADLRFGEDIRLLGFSLPNGSSYRAGEAVEISLLWGTETPLDRDFTVASFIVDPDTGQPLVQGKDTGPQDGFAPTSSWQVGTPVWDNRAMRLPANAPAGDYHIWLLLYSYDDESGEIERLPVDGASTAEKGTVGVLPITLTIE